MHSIVHIHFDAICIQLSDTTCVNNAQTQEIDNSQLTCGSIDVATVVCVAAGWGSCSSRSPRIGWAASKCQTPKQTGKMCLI